MLLSVIIRTYNEQKQLNEVLTAVSMQEHVEFEIVIVDSGSTDSTLDIAKRYRCRITHISSYDFTFGRSLNKGCEFAQGDLFVFLSGHCIPASSDWLYHLVQPLLSGSADYSYGKQLGKDSTKFSEYQVFEKYFPAHSCIPQAGFFCNNANAAITRSLWHRFGFNEELTGLEDMYLAKQLVESGGLVAYVANAPVFHIHNESWRGVMARYEREAIALQKIMPEVQVDIFDTLRYMVSAILNDLRLANKQKQLAEKTKEIILFRVMQYWGTYRGNHEHRKLSMQKKEKYFYPNNS